MRRLLLAGFRRMLGFTRNPLGAFGVLEVRYFIRRRKSQGISSFSEESSAHCRRDLACLRSSKGLPDSVMHPDLLNWVHFRAQRTVNGSGNWPAITVSCNS